MARRREKMPSYLSPRTLIKQGYYTNKEYEQYKENRQKIQAMNLRERTKELVNEEKYREAKRTYEDKDEMVFPQRIRVLPWQKKNQGIYVPTRITKVARKTSGFLARNLPQAQTAVASKRGFVNALYRGQGQLPPTNVENRFQTIQGMKSGKRGRPAGTLDKRYAAYGGVYNFRKEMAHRRFLERQRILQERAVTPQQQAILQQIRNRDAYARSNPEGQIIPNTNGNVFMDNIMDDINRAANIVG